VSIQGQRIIVELQNDSTVTGSLEEVDPNMNMVLCEAVQTMHNGTVREVEIISINGSNIRYVHLPSSANIMSSVANYANDFKRQTGKKGQIFDRKKKRPLTNDGGASAADDIVLESKVKW